MPGRRTDRNGYRIVTTTTTTTVTSYLMEWMYLALLFFLIFFVLSPPSRPGITSHQSIRRRKEESVVRGAIERAAKEVEGCTFKPQTTECPAYITVSVCIAPVLLTLKHHKRKPLRSSRNAVKRRANPSSGSRHRALPAAF